MPDPVQSPANIQTVTMTGSFVKFSPAEKLKYFLIKMRTSVSLQVSYEADGAPFFTIPADDSLVMGSNNWRGQPIFFNAAGATVVEIMTIDKP